MLNQETDNYFLKLLAEAEEVLEKSYNTIFRVITITKGYFTKPTAEDYETIVEQNLKMPVISYKGDTEQEMKFQGKTIHKNTKCNTWYTRYRTNGKQIYISGKTQKEVLQELKSQLNYTKKEKKKTLTLLDWYNQWLELFKVGKVKETTISEYKNNMNHITKELQNYDIKKITSMQIITILNNIEKTRTRQKVYEFLKDLFTKAQQYNICNNIINIIEKPRHKKEHGIGLTTEDKLKLENYCKIKKYYLFLVILYQGLRKGEALALTWEDIDFKNNTININKSLNKKSQFDTTKKDSSNRLMPLFQKTKEILKNIPQTENRIFNFSHSAPNKQFDEIKNNLNLNKKYTIHSLRHTFITYCQDNQIPEHIIQNWVGHQIGSNVTKQVYTHIQFDTNNLFINKLNNTKFYSNSTRE